MKKPIVIIGIGQMAGVFARGFLRSGYPVYPITREMNLEAESRQIEEVELVLLAVGENELDDALQSIPSIWQDKLVLLQNELLPRSWKPHISYEITAVSVWFEKKKGQDAKVLLASPVFGPKADIIYKALLSIEIPARVLQSEQELLYELVLKNVYILTTNISGLEVGGTVKDLWQDHSELASSVAEEIVLIQEFLSQETFSPQQLIKDFIKAMDADPEHKCMGRSAASRLSRALGHGKLANLDLPVLSSIAKKHL